MSCRRRGGRPWYAGFQSTESFLQSSDLLREQIDLLLLTIRLRCVVGLALFCLRP
jgi:hypothetical protein